MTVSLLSSRCFIALVSREGIQQEQFSTLLCTNKTEAPDDRAEREGKSAEYLGIQPGVNPQRRETPLPPRAQRAETYSWALLSREICL